MNHFILLQNKLSNVNIDLLYVRVCKNIKKFRLEKYNEFKLNNTKFSFNPYSTEKIAELLDYNHNHYKRFESENDSTKRMPLEKIYKLSIILDKKIDDFFQ